MSRRRVAPLARFALASACGDSDALTRAIDAARRAGWPRAALEEVALMLTLYSGYPSAIECLRTLDERWPARPPSAGEVPEDERAKRGLATLARIYAADRPALLRGLARRHPALASWVVDHGYGRVLARDRLDLRTRELVTVAMLAAGGWERQLASHALGSTRAGATAAEVAALVREGRAAARRPEPARGEAALRLTRKRTAGARR